MRNARKILEHAKHYIVYTKQVDLMKRVHFDDRVGNEDYAREMNALEDAASILNKAWYAQ